MKLFESFKKKDYSTKDEKPSQPFTDSNVSNATSGGNGLGVMSVDNVFALMGRGCVVTGKISKGCFSVGDTVEIVHDNGNITPTSVRGIEINMRSIDIAQAGDNAALQFIDVDKRSIQQGDIVRQTS